MADATGRQASSFDAGTRGGKLRLFAVLAGVMLVAAVVERSFVGAPGQRWVGAWLAGDEPGGAGVESRLDASAGEPGSFVAERSAPPPTGWDDALARVEDDTLIFRPVERGAWELIDERLRDAEPATLKTESLGEIGFTQLVQQVEAYRGRVVTVRGRVMYASRVDLRLDDHSEHDTNGKRFALWIMPAGGPALPIVAYVKSLPPGFPAVGEQGGGRLTKLRENVKVTGIVLKRGSYVATDGLRTAPVIIASGPDWMPDAALGGRAVGLGHAREWFWATAGAATVLAIGLVAAAMRLIRPTRGQGRGTTSERLAAVDFRGVAIGPTTAEALRQMERRRNE